MKDPEAEISIKKPTENDYSLSCVEKKKVISR